MSSSDIKLITLVRSFPHLYDKNNIEYKNKICHENSWKYIADELNLQVEDCTSRWQALRNRYSKERSKVSADAGHQKEWVLLKYLGFLNTVVKKRKTFGMGTIENKNEIVEETKQEQASPHVFSFLEIVNAQNSEDCEDTSSNPPRLPITFVSATTTPSPIQIKKRKLGEAEVEANCSTLSRTSTESETQCKVCSDEQTSIKSFCVSLVEDMARMKPSDLRKCKIEMLQTICKYSND